MARIEHNHITSDTAYGGNPLVLTQSGGYWSTCLALVADAIQATHKRVPINLVNTPIWLLRAEDTYKSCKEVLIATATSSGGKRDYEMMQMLALLTLELEKANEHCDVLIALSKAPLR